MSSNAASPRATLAQKVYGVPGRVNRTHTGNSATAAIELTETYPDTQSSAAHTTADSAMASGARARNIPVAVATPLPPLNRTWIFVIPSAGILISVASSMM